MVGVIGHLRCFVHRNLSLVLSFRSGMISEITKAKMATKRNIWNLSILEDSVSPCIIESA